MTKEEGENPGKKPVPKATDEQAIENLIQMRKYQLDALNKIMSSITPPTNNFSSNQFESTSPHDTRLKRKSKP